MKKCLLLMIGLLLFTGAHGSASSRKDSGSIKITNAITKSHLGMKKGHMALSPGKSGIIDESVLGKGYLTLYIPAKNSFKNYPADYVGGCLRKLAKTLAPKQPVGIKAGLKDRDGSIARSPVKLFGSKETSKDVIELEKGVHYEVSMGLDDSGYGTLVFKKVADIPELQ